MKGDFYLFNDIEKNMKLIVLSQEVIPDDKLSKLIASVKEQELNEYELELVTAAAKPDYEKFKLFLESKGVKY